MFDVEIRRRRGGGTVIRHASHGYWLLHTRTKTVFNIGVYTIWHSMLQVKQLITVHWKLHKSNKQHLAWSTQCFRENIGESEYVWKFKQVPWVQFILFFFHERRARILWVRYGFQVETRIGKHRLETRTIHTPIPFALEWMFAVNPRKLSLATRSIMVLFTVSRKYILILQISIW